MTKSKKTPVYRILTIDDNQSIHQDFAKILMRTRSENPELDDLEKSLFGVTKSEEKYSPDFTLDFAMQGDEGLTMVEKALAARNPYALAFVDGRMPPGMDGIETIQALWERDPELQVVLCTAYADYSWQEIRNILGETDNLLILKKPFDNMEVLQMAHALTRKWALAKEIRGRLHHLAFYDMLTSLPNRAMLMERLSVILKHARQNDTQAALLFIDMDNFKLINDSLGHNIGDKLLKVIARRIVFCLRASDVVGRWTAARIGGDEFIVILPQVASEHAATQVAQRIIDKISRPLTLDGYRILVTLSIGVSFYPQDGKNSEELLKNADLAMFAAKRTSQNSIVYYQKSMNQRAVKRLALENALRQALGRNEFSLHYQPQLDLRTGKVSGMEALLRWHNHVLGEVSPAEFIKVAEELGLIVDIGTWVLRTACVQLRIWQKQGLCIPRMSVNVSLKQFSHSDFVSTVKEALQYSGLQPEFLELEITETFWGGNVFRLEDIVRQLRAMQISIAIDDFGTGYAGVSRFREIQVDRLKIDRSFVKEIENSTSAQNLIKGIVAMAKCLKLDVVSEGIETLAQLEFLRSVKCEQMQGYLYSKPLPVADAELFLRNPPVLASPAANI